MGNLFFISFSIFRIFHVNMTTFEKKLLKNTLSIWLKNKIGAGLHPPHGAALLDPAAFGLRPQPHWLAFQSGSQESSSLQFTVNHCWTNTKSTITQKIKITKIKIIFYSIQRFAHLSWQWEQFWGEGLHILTWHRAKQSNN